ncbi:MAG: sulfite exporter TauE/SafE family protein [Pseudomonadota bacterium]
MIEPLAVALVTAAFFVGGFIKGAIGMGLPVVVLATLALIMPLREAMAIFLIPGFASNLWQATSGPWIKPLLARIWSFLLGAALAIVIGVWIMSGTKSEIMAVVLGVLLFFYSIYSLVAPRLPEPGRHEPWMSPLFGGAGGIFFGMAGIFIVPGLLYLETLRIPRDQFVQALGMTFLTITTTLAVSMTGFNLVTWKLAILSACGLVPVFLGIWLGRRIRHRVSEAFYRKLFFIALAITGIYMVVRAVASDSI